MNIKNILHTVFITLILTLISAYIFSDYNLENNIGLFIGMFIMYYGWSYFINLMKPRQITKNSDEFIHPVTENVTILHGCNIQKHYGKMFQQRNIEICICGSTLFRNYHEITEKGTLIQPICVKCNTKSTGIEFNWKEQK